MKPRRLCYAALLLAPLALLVLAGGWAWSHSTIAPTVPLVGRQADGSYLVPTGQTLTPAGKDLRFVGRPVDMALQPGGRFLAVLTPDGVRLLDTAAGNFLAPETKDTSSFGGVAWSPDGRALYHCGAIGDRTGSTGVVYVGQVSPDGAVTPSKPIQLPFKPQWQPDRASSDSAPCALSISPDGNTLYVALFNNGTVAAVNLQSYDPITGHADYTEIPVGSSPAALLVSGGRVYVADRGGDAPHTGDVTDPDDPVVVNPATYKAAGGAVSVIDAARIGTDPDHAVIATIQVGIQPAALAASPTGSRIFVANANSDTVSVIDSRSNSVIETIPVSPAPDRLGDSSPNGLAVTKDGQALYVTLGGDNAVECVRLDQAAGGSAPRTRIQGLIPTAWFPLNVALSPDDGTLYVANSKGVGSLGPEVPFRVAAGMQSSQPQQGPGGIEAVKGYPAHSVYAVVGSVSVIPAPGAAALKRETAQVARNDHFDRMREAMSARPDPFWSRFKHVILVVKENRTYDQVLGDMPTPAGSPGGDPHLVMFGEEITPNQHALARRFGLFDNLYCSGEISADGHHWLHEAFADDYVERAMDRYPREYPCCGGDPLSYSGAQFLWQAAMQSGESFRDYGEWNPLRSMQIHASRSYNGHYTVTPVCNEDVAHAQRLIDSISAHALPRFTTIWFPNDHTSGTRPGAYTPESDVADNDQAVGMLISYLSHSKRYWREEPTAVFMIEDDAQGGLDHIDGHRTVGLVVSPYNRRGKVFSRMFNQLSFVRTIEEMLDLKPLGQMDAATEPMRSVFQTTPDYQPYDLEKARIALNLRNPQLSALKGEARRWARVTARLDFSAPDRADPELLTRDLWHATHGAASYPPPSASRG